MQKDAIQIENVTKIYKLFDRNRDRLADSLGLPGKKRYREHYALSDLSFSIQKGETVGIIGTNGAGKSTILKIITGVLSQTSGRVAIDGRISALLELGAGFNMEYTGIENVYLNGMMMGFSREEIDAKLDAILSFADIGDFVYQPVKMYSSGMFVRLAFAVAINIEPEILIVDEALSVGDVFFQAKCFHKFEEFKQEGKTILFVSHDLGSIQKYCDRALLLHHGKLVGQGAPGDVIDMYKRVLAGESAELLKNEEGHAEDAVDAYALQLGGQTGAGTGDADVVANLDHTGKKVWKNVYALNPEVDEYGDHIAEIVDFCLLDDKGTMTDTLIKGNAFTLKVKVRANENIDNPIVAFTIRDARGMDLCGTNTMLEKKDPGALLAGEEMVVSFTQPMDLQGGAYLLCLGLTRFENDDFHVYHRFYDILHLTVISVKDSVGIYDMNTQIEVEK